MSDFFNKANVSHVSTPHTALERVWREREQDESGDEWLDTLADALEAFEDNVDPDEILHEIFGLEPDFVYDLLSLHNAHFGL